MADSPCCINAQASTTLGRVEPVHLVALRRAPGRDRRRPLDRQQAGQSVRLEHQTDEPPPNPGRFKAQDQAQEEGQSRQVSQRRPRLARPASSTRRRRMSLDTGLSAVPPDRPDDSKGNCRGCHRESGRRPVAKPRAGQRPASRYALAVAARHTLVRVEQHECSQARGEWRFETTAAPPAITRRLVLLLIDEPEHVAVA